MKILVFEYITGGGFNKQALPHALATEGRLMLNALLNNLIPLNNLDITVMLDERLHDAMGVAGINTVIIGSGQDIAAQFSQLVEQADAVWPIAPEFDGILQDLCHIVEALGKTLLTSPAAAVAIAGNKLKTYQRLLQHQIDTVPTRLFDSIYRPGEWIVKPLDGVGCADSYVMSTSQDFADMAGCEGQYIIQPHLQGAKTSLSCLFKQGRGWLICANLQRFDLINRQYQLAAIVVNHPVNLESYQRLINKIAAAFPELWGYVGIDLIETAEQRYVLEINPRLTTSFVGIAGALGINVAEAVLQLVQGAPILAPRCNKAITVQAK